VGHGVVVGLAQHPVADLVDELAQHIALVAEIEIKGALGDVGTPHDLVHRGLGDPLFSEQGICRVEKILLFFLLLLFQTAAHLRASSQKGLSSRL